MFDLALLALQLVVPNRAAIDPWGRSRLEAGHLKADLFELLGPDAARLFLMSVLGIVSAGLSSGRSMRLIEDEIEAELLTRDIAELTAKER